MATRSELVHAVETTLLGGEVEGLRDWFHPDVVWGGCHRVDMVMSMIADAFAGGVSITSGTVKSVADRLVVDLVGSTGNESFDASLAMFDVDGLIVEMHGPTSADHARSTSRSGPFVASDTGVEFESIAPVFPASDVAASAAQYEALGFRVELYEGPASYAFAHRGPVSIHLAHVGDVDAKTNMSAAYLYVNDAKALFAEWRAADAGGRLHAPVDTDYGLCEGAHLDRDGNLIRFGSPIATP